MGGNEKIHKAAGGSSPYTPQPSGLGAAKKLPGSLCQHTPERQERTGGREGALAQQEVFESMSMNPENQPGVPPAKSSLKYATTRATQNSGARGADRDLQGEDPHSSAATPSPLTSGEPKEQVDAHAAPSLIPPAQLLTRRNFLAGRGCKGRLEQWEGAGERHNVFSRLSDPTGPIKGNNL